MSLRRKIEAGLVTTAVVTGLVLGARGDKQPANVAGDVDDHLGKDRIACECDKNTGQCYEQYSTAPYVAKRIGEDGKEYEYLVNPTNWQEVPSCGADRPVNVK